MNSEVKINTGKYIDGELKGEALRQFEKLLTTDADLQEEVRFQKEIFTALKAKSEFEAEKEEVISFLEGLEKKVDLSNLENEKAEISTREKSLAKETSSQSSIIRKLLPFASLAAAAAVLLFVFAPWKSNFTGSELADKNFNDFLLESVRSTNDQPNSFENAKKAYQRKDYQAASVGFSQYLNKNENASKIWLAKGTAEYRLDLLDEAIVGFEKAATQNSNYRAIVNWYLALCHLKKEDKAQAKAALGKIAKGEEKYAEAQKLLKKL